MRLRTAFLGGDLLGNAGFKIRRVTGGCLNTLEIFRCAIPVKEDLRIPLRRLGRLPPIKKYAMRARAILYGE